MSPIDPRTLRSYVQTPREGGTCWSCGYELAGLIADVCPECGADISAEAADRAPGALRGWERGSGGKPSRRQPRRFASRLGEAPIGWLRIFHRSCITMMVSPLLVATAYTLWRFGYDVIAANTMLLASFAWYTATYFLTRARPRMPGIEIDVSKEWRLSRWATRGLQPGWIVSSALLVAEANSTGGIGQPWLIVALVAAYVGMLGLLPLLLYFANLMDWADDTEFAYRIRGCSMLIAVGLFLTASIPVLRLLGGIIASTLWAVMILLFVVLYIIVLVFPILYSLYTMYQVTRIAGWAVKNHSTRRAIDDRMMQKSLDEQKRGEYERWRADQLREEADREALIHKQQNRPAPGRATHQLKPARAAKPDSQNAPTQSRPSAGPDSPSASNNDDLGDIYAIAPDEPPPRG